MFIMGIFYQNDYLGVLPTQTRCKSRTLLLLMMRTLTVAMWWGGDDIHQNNKNSDSGRESDNDDAKMFVDVPFVDDNPKLMQRGG